MAVGMPCKVDEWSIRKLMCLLGKLLFIAWAISLAVKLCWPASCLKSENGNCLPVDINNIEGEIVLPSPIAKTDLK